GPALALMLATFGRHTAAPDRAGITAFGGSTSPRQPRPVAGESHDVDVLPTAPGPRTRRRPPAVNAPSGPPARPAGPALAADRTPAPASGPAVPHSAPAPPVAGGGDAEAVALHRHRVPRPPGPQRHLCVGQVAQKGQLQGSPPRAVVARSQVLREVQL